MAKSEKLAKIANSKNIAKNWLGEFKEFINRGNVIDLAVGVIIGGAFGKIVSSLVADILMPIIGVMMGGLNFSSLSINLGSAQINYGLFIQNVVDFLIVAACIFVIIKFLNRIKKKPSVEKAVEETIDYEKESLKVLEEIRDKLAHKK